MKANPAEVLLSFGVDSFYPGGWTGDNEHNGAIIDLSRMTESNQKIVPNFNLHRDMRGGY